jgi:hypothetical protein
MDIVVGENTDLIIRGTQFHVQTEDWGSKEKALLSRVFRNGAVIKTFKLGYEKITNVNNPSSRRATLVQFHQLVIENVKATII